MSGDLYRDAHVGIRARLGELRMRLEEREAEVTPSFWDALSKDVRARLESLRKGSDLVADDSDDLDELTRAEGKLAAYIDELDGLIASLPALEATWAEVPDEVGEPPGARVNRGADFATGAEAWTVIRDLSAMVRERTRDLETSGEPPTSVVRFRERGCPFALRATTHANGNGGVGEVSMWLVTSIARALPPLFVRHENLVLSVGKVLGLKHDVEVGDPSFDGLFIIEGTQEAADLFLGPAMRVQLLALARFDVPTLHVDPVARRASIHWRFEPAPKALEAAVRILTAIRETPPSIRFRR